jgi:hypothetical protein
MAGQRMSADPQFQKVAVALVFEQEREGVV